MIKLGYILLRDIPKKVVSIDGVRIPIEGGCRGFRFVTPGPHYITVDTFEDTCASFWCFLPEGKCMIKCFDQEHNCFVDDTPESEQHYKKLARSRALDSTLLDFPHAEANPFWQSSFYIKMYGSLPPEKSIDETMTVTQLIVDVYNKNKKEALADFQYTFLKMFIGSHINLSDRDLVATRKWTDLIIILYSATAKDVSRYATFIVQWTSVLIDQLNHLPTHMFAGPRGASAFFDIVVYGAGPLVEHMKQSKRSEVPEQGRYFEEYLQERRSCKN